MSPGAEAPPPPVPGPDCAGGPASALRLRLDSCSPADVFAEKRTRLRCQVGAVGTERSRSCEPDMGPARVCSEAWRLLSNSQVRVMHCCFQ
jgi:predicted metal-binding protein